MQKRCVFPLARLESSEARSIYSVQKLTTSATRYVCVHSHCYQPPREDPWTNEVEPELTAWPFHDWNERIAAECYTPNTAAHILDGDLRIVKTVNNYSQISFDF